MPKSHHAKERACLLPRKQLLVVPPLKSFVERASSLKLTSGAHCFFSGLGNSFYELTIPERTILCFAAVCSSWLSTMLALLATSALLHLHLLGFAAALLAYCLLCSLLSAARLLLCSAFCLSAALLLLLLASTAAVSCYAADCLLMQALPPSRLLRCWLFSCLLFSSSN
ncbi:hypothetical protein Tco_0458118 [Tanacetum coccineum]